ncbi:MAG TPA: nucleotide exchange factor GrpE [Cyclobacteriaceae bacterium]|nr:nucleotide exchange factor GrpE [Cyclobacteriaceae bacterium]
MMENTVQPDKELEKQEENKENQSAVPPAQQQEQEIIDPRDQVKRLQDDLTEAKDKYLRLYAEFDNYRRRTAKEKIEMIQSANENLINLLLPVIDDFERAEKSFKHKNDKGAEGFFLIQSKFKKILETCGVGLMETKVGSDFNPDLHDAITQVPAPEEDLKGKIVDVVEKGYTLNDKVIRHAKVVVGN